jgi:hypothetical protein
MPEGDSPRRRTAGRGALNRRMAAFLAALAVGLSASLLAPSLSAAGSIYPDMRGTYHGGTCVGGTLAECEANGPQYPGSLVITAENFSNGKLTMKDVGQVAQITGCTLVIDWPESEGYKSTDTFTISSNTNHLSGSFDDSFGRVNQPDFMQRDAPGPDTCPVSSTKPKEEEEEKEKEKEKTPTKIPTVTAVQCFISTTAPTTSSTCTADVAAAAPKATAAPSGAVLFTSTSGTFVSQGCTLAVDRTFSPTVSSCTMGFIPSPTLTPGNALNVTAAYQGDAIYAPSKASVRNGAAAVTSEEEPGEPSEVGEASDPGASDGDSTEGIPNVLTNPNPFPVSADEQLTVSGEGTAYAPFRAASAKRHVIGHVTVKLSAFGSVKTKIRLTRAGAKLLHRKHKLHVTLTVTTHAKGKPATISKRRLLIKR